MSYLNYLGMVMAESAAPGGSVFGTSAGGETLTAPAGPSLVDGNGGGDLLIGGGGDVTFNVKDLRDTVQVGAGLSGVKTVVAFNSFALPVNVQNLTVHGDFNYAVGNSLDNLILVDGSQWVAGGRGNDVLVGAATQRTTFVETLGDGNDVIYNWNPNSQLQLNGFGLNTPAQIRGAMSQVGADVVIHLSASDSLTIRNVTPAAIADRQLLTALDTSKLGAMTLDDEFNSLNTVNPSTGAGLWETNFGGNLKDQQAYTLTANGERQAYVAPGFQGQGDHDLGVNPFSVSNGVLTVTAAPTAAADLHGAYGLAYTSGMLNTLDTFQQKYGYFEIRAQLPAATGAWPAFWMLPHPYQPNMEADIFEGLGITPNIDYRRAYGGAETIYDNALKIDPNGFHTYGMLWTPSTVSFYLDGVEVLSGATPTAWTQPMALILNMAVGGFGGVPNPAQFPASMQVDYIHAYALADGSSVVQHTAPVAPAATLHDDGATSGQASSPPFFADGSAPVTSAQVLAMASRPGSAPAAKTFITYQDSGAVFGVVSDGHSLSAPVGLGAFSGNPFTGAGTWLTDGRVVAGYLQANAAGGQDAWDVVFDPAKQTFVRQDLGPATGNLHFVATANGGFAVSWHAPDGTVEARGYDAFAYGGDTPGWYGPTSAVAGDFTGVTADGHVIAQAGAGQELYHMLNTTAAGVPLPGGRGPVALDPTIASEISAVLRGEANASSSTALSATLSAGLASGSISQAQALQQIIVAAENTSSVATLAYEFFTGKAPSAAGMDFLVSPTGPNPNNLNAAYYQSFSLENRYINFAVNLGKVGEGNAAFTAAYGNLSLFEATRKAYATIFGEAPSDTKLHAILDPTTVLNGVTFTRSDYFAYYGQDGANGIGTKAAMVGYLLAEAEKADLGVYAKSNDAFLTDVALHNAPFGVDLIGVYNQPGFVFHPG